MRICISLWGFLFILLSTLCRTHVETSAIQGRIISGTPAALGQFPWQVIIKEDEEDNLKCGGSIISDIWVITAAHCIADLQSVFLAFGSIELDNTANNMTSTEIYIHPEYSPPIVNDIALIRLPRPLNFSNSNIQPIAMISQAQASQNFIGTVAIIAGFGITDDDYLDYSQILLWAQVKLISISVCKSAYPLADINETNFCATGDGNTNMSICSGDSGGPLIVIVNGSPIQIGINSFVAKEQCTQGFPSGYVRISAHFEYISQVTGLSFN